MKVSERRGIWSLWFDLADRQIVIPTNIGWKEDGSNVMGAGLAKKAAEFVPALPRWYGEFCRKHRENTPVVKYPLDNIVLFPVKPLNPDAPWLSWKQKASTELIERSAQQLSVMDGKYLVPLVGCGNGGLDPKEVFPILEFYLHDPKFILVLR